MFTRLFLFFSVLCLTACGLAKDEPSFQMQYYHTDRPETLYDGGRHPRISLGFAGTFHGIPGEKLGVIWQGRIRQPESGTLILQHSEANKLELKVNGNTVPLKGGHTELPLERGHHDISLIYEPQWFADEIAVHFLNERPVPPEEAAAKIRSATGRKHTIAYAQVAGKVDTSDPKQENWTWQDARLHVPAADKPLVLILAANKLSHVELIPEADADIKAIIALNGIAAVSGSQAPVYRLDWRAPHDWWPKGCHCTGGVQFHCSSGVDEALPAIRTLSETLFERAPDFYHHQSEWKRAAFIDQQYQEAVKTHTNAQAKCGGAQALRFDNAVKGAEADKGWFARIGGEVPQSGFRAFYFTQDEIGKPVAEEHVPHISVNYARAKDLHNIEPEQFAALWVGKIRVYTDTTFDMQYDLSWAQLRVRVNGETVHQTRNSIEPFTLTLAAGEHLIEVEYINHWHTVGFSLHPQRKLPERISSEAQQKAEDLLNDQRYSIIHAEVYESSTRDNRITLNPPSTEKPAVLVLRSHRAVFWQIAPGTRIEAVIMQEGKGSVSGIDAPVYRLPDPPKPNRADWRFYQYETDKIRNFTPVFKKP